MKQETGKRKWQPVRYVYRIENFYGEGMTGETTNRDYAVAAWLEGKKIQRRYEKYMSNGRWRWDGIWVNLPTKRQEEAR